MAMQSICILYTMLWMSQDALENDPDIRKGQNNLTSLEVRDPVYKWELFRDQRFSPMGVALQEISP